MVSNFSGGVSNFSGGGWSPIFLGGGSSEYDQRSAGTHPTGMHSCFHKNRMLKFTAEINGNLSIKRAIFYLVY